MKTCSRCKESKSLDSFAGDNKRSDGKRPSCKQCNRAFYKQNYSKGDRPTPMTEEEKRKIRSDYYKDNKEMLLAKHAKWRSDNKDTVKGLNRAWYEKNGKQYYKDRYENDLNFRMLRVIRSRLNSAIKNCAKTGSAVSSLGCSIEELKSHLAEMFQPGMSWDNWGKGDGKWNIDHIIPLSSFDLSNPDEFNKACNYKNLQPLWEFDNLSKKDRLI